MENVLREAKIDVKHFSGGRGKMQRIPDWLAMFSLALLFRTSCSHPYTFFNTSKLLIPNLDVVLQAPH